MTPEEIPHSQVHGHTRQAVIYLETLFNGNHPADALSQVVFNRLSEGGMTASDFRSRLDYQAGFNDYDHFSDYDGWQAVQTYMEEYLRSGRTLSDLVGVLFEVIGFDFTRHLERLYNPNRINRLQVRPRRGTGGPISSGHY